jgi:hypothetical protein
MTNFTKLLLCLVGMYMLRGEAKAQLSGVYTVPGSYASLASAISDLNTQGVSGPVFIDIAAGHTETVTTGGYTLTASGTALNPVTFRKSGTGANPLLVAYAGGTATPASARQDGVWQFIGSDYITIDGIDILDPNTASPATMEYGYGFFKAGTSDGCQYNTIRNCVISLNASNSASGGGPSPAGSRGINVANTLFSAQTTALLPLAFSGSNSYNRFYANTIRNCNIGIALIGYAAPAPYTLADRGNDAGGLSPADGNLILNFGGLVPVANPAAGIMTLAQYDLNLSYNRINNNDGTGADHIHPLRGIYVNTAQGAGLVISHNTVTLNGAGTTVQVCAIENAAGSAANGNTVSIHSNEIRSCSNASNTTGSFIGIYNNGAAPDYLQIRDNIFSGILTQATTGSNYLVYNTGAVQTALSITGNRIEQCGNSAGTSGAFYGIFNNVATPGTLDISSNTFSNQVSAAVTGPTYLIYNANTVGGPLSLNNNTVTACSHSVSGSGVFYGIFNNGASADRLEMKGNLFQDHRVQTFSGACHMLYNTGAATNSISISQNAVVNCTNTIASTGAYYGIYNNAAATSALDISANTFRDHSLSATSGSIHLIFNRGAAANTFVSGTMNHNLISNCAYSATSSPFLGVYNALVTMSDLSISSNTLSGISWTSANALRYLVYNTGAVTNVLLMNHNLLSQVSSTNNTTGVFHGINNSGSFTVGLQMSDNTLTDLRNTATTGGTYLMINSGAAPGAVITMTGNAVRDFSTAATGTSEFLGISNTGTAYAELEISRNTYSNTQVASFSGQSAFVYNSGTSPATINRITFTNNLFVACTNSVSAGGATYGVYNNAVNCLSLSLSDNTFSNTAIYAVNGANHMVYNRSTATATFSSIRLENNLVTGCTHSASAGAGFYSIWNNGGVSSLTSVSNNTITASSWQSVSALRYLVSNWGVAVSSASLSGNLISNCTSTNNTTAAFYAIYNNNNTSLASGDLFIRGNRLIDNVTSATTGETHLINNTGGVLTNTFTSILVSENVISNYSATVDGGGAFFGIYNNAASFGSLNVSRNSFTGVALTTSTGAVYFVYNRGVNGNVFEQVSITENLVSSLVHTNNANGNFLGIANTGGATTTCPLLTISTNSFVGAELSGSTGAIHLIYNTCPVSTLMQVEDNLFSGISNTITTTAAFFGINNAGGTSAGDLTIRGNVFRGLESSATTGHRRLIYNAAAFSNSVMISTNQVSACSHTVTGNGGFWGIQNSPSSSGLFTMLGANTFSNNYTSGSSTLILNTGAASSTLNTIAITGNLIADHVNNSSAVFVGIANTGLSSNSLSINSNSLTGLSLSTGGSAIHLILNSGRVDQVLKIQGNLVANMSGTLGGQFNGILNTLNFANANSPSVLDITGNRFEIMDLSPGSGTCTFINNSGVATNTILLNQISGNLLSGLSLNGTGGFSGISNTTLMSDSLSIRSNTILNVTLDNTTGQKRMIYNTGAVISQVDVSDNLTAHLSATMNTTGFYIGLQNAGSTQGNLNIHNNRFEDHELTATTGFFMPVYNTGVSSGTISITDNQFSSLSYSAATSGTFSGIFNNAGSAAALSMSANTFTRLSLSSATGVAYLLYNRGVAANTIQTISFTGNVSGDCSYSATGGQFCGILNSGTSFGHMGVASNTFVNTEILTATAARYFIYNTGIGTDSLAIRDNLLSGFSSTANTSASFFAIHNGGAQRGDLSLTGNSFLNYELSSTSGSAYLIYNTGVTDNEIRVSNNLISGITHSATTGGGFFAIYNNAASSSSLSVRSNSLANIVLYTTNGATHFIYNRNAASSSTIQTIRITDNVFSTCSYSASSGAFYGIFNNATAFSELQVENNAFDNISSISVTGVRYFFYNTGAGATLIALRSNSISGYTASGNTTGGFYDILNTGACAGDLEISGNTFSAQVLPATTGVSYCIYNTGSVTGSLTVSQNLVSSLSHTSTSGVFYGIFTSGGTSAALSIIGNTLNNISTTNSVSVKYLFYNTTASSGDILIRQNTLSGYSAPFNTTGAFAAFWNTGAAQGNLAMTENSVGPVIIPATTGICYMLYNTGAVTGSVNISANLATSISHTSTTGAFYGFYNNGGPCTALSMSDNTIQAVSTTNSVSIKYMIYNTGGVSQDNNISNNLVSAYTASLNTTGTFAGVYNTGAVQGRLAMSGNTLSAVSLAATTGTFYGIYNNGVTGSTVSLSNNLLSGLESNAAATGAFYGVYNLASAAPELNMNGNTLSHSAFSLSAGPACFVCNTATAALSIPAIRMDQNTAASYTWTSGSGNFYGVYNNAVSSASLSLSSNTFSHAVFAAANSTCYLVHNNGSVTGGMSLTNNSITACSNSLNTGGSLFGVYNAASGGGVLDMSGNSFANNIFSAPTTTSYMVYNSAAIAGTVHLSQSSLSGNTTSGEFYAVHNTGSAPELRIDGNQFQGNTSEAVSTNMYLLGNTGSVAGRISFSANTLGYAFNNSLFNYGGDLYNIYNAGGTTSSTLSVDGNTFTAYSYPLLHGGGNLYFIHNTHNNDRCDIINNSWQNLSLNHVGNEYLIYNASATARELNVLNNTASGYTRTATAAALYLYYGNGNSPATCTQVISGNHFSNISALTPGSGSFYGIYNADGTGSTYPKKIISGNSISQVNYAGLGFFYGYYANFLGDASGTGSAVYDNTLSLVSWQGPVYGLYIGGNVSSVQAPAVYSNTVLDLTASGATSALHGMYLQGGGAGLEVYKNRIAGLRAGGTQGTAHGIYVSQAATTGLSNNLIGNIYAPVSAHLNAVNGIYVSGGSRLNVYYNTIYLDAQSTGAVFGSSGLFASSSVSLDLRNNNIINVSQPGGAGLTVAYQRNTPALGSYLGTSGQNNFYAGLPSASRLIFTDGVVKHQVLPAYQAFVTPRDQTSVTEDVNFLSTSSAAPDFLHVDPAIPSLTESGALNIPGITDDVDGELRSGNPGYTGTGTAPDIGADEYDLNPAPCSAVHGGTASLASVGAICEGESLYMQTTGATAAGGMTYQWRVASVAGGPYTNVSGGSGATTRAHLSPTLSPGDYYYIMVATCTIGGLSAASNELTITVHPTPAASASVLNAVLCSGESLSLSGSSQPGMNYLWTGPDNYLSTAQNPVIPQVETGASGTYTLLVSGTTCTSQPALVTVTVRPTPPVFSLSPSGASLCIGGSQTLSASIPVNSPTLSFGAQTQQNVASGYPAPYSGYYGGQKMQMLILAGELAAAGFTTGTPIHSLQFPVASLGSNWNMTLFDCQDFSVSMKATSTSVLSAFETGLTNVVPASHYTPVPGFGNVHSFTSPFIWDGSSNLVIETVFSNSITGTAANAVIQYHTPTGFRSTLVYRADNMHVSALAAATASNANIGFVRPDFRLNGMQVGSYSWTPATGLSSTTGMSVTASPTVSGIYTVQLSDAHCASTSTVALDVILVPTLNISASASTVCLGNTTTLTASGATSYTWSTSAAGASVVVTPFVSTTYTVQGANPVCPVATETIFITSVPALTLNTSVIPSVLCLGESSTLTVSGASTYTWTGGSTAASLVVTPGSTSQYTVQAADGPGCWTSRVLSVKVNPLPLITITPGTATVCSGEPIQLEAAGVFSFTWAPGSSNSPILLLSPTASEVYSVTGMDFNGCVSTASASITVDPCTKLSAVQGHPEGIRLYPNPGQGRVFLEFPTEESRTIRVENTAGTLVYATEMDEISGQIDLSDLARGLYFVRISQGGSSVVYKLVLQ